MVKVSKSKSSQISKRKELASCVEVMEKRIERLAVVLGGNFVRGEALGAKRAQQKRDAIAMLEKESAEL